MWIELRRIEFPKLLNLSNNKAEMIYPRYDHTLVSTSFDLYCIGGHNGNSYITQCESFNSITKKWNLVVPLNCTYCRPTAIFAYPSALFTLGSNNDKTFEKLKLNLFGNLGNSWEKFQVSNATSRGYGVAVQLNINEILIFGGSGGNQEEFEIFDIQKKILNKNLKKFINSSYFNTSKPRIFHEKVYIISYNNPKLTLFKIDLKNNLFEQLPPGF